MLLFLLQIQKLRFIQTYTVEILREFNFESVDGVAYYAKNVWTTIFLLIVIFTFKRDSDLHPLAKSL